jgi:hypothetical protein
MRDIIVRLLVFVAFSSDPFPRRLVLVLIAYPGGRNKAGLESASRGGRNERRKMVLPWRAFESRMAAI